MVRRFGAAALLGALAVLVLISGCATLTPLRPVPAWVLEPPANDSAYEYFVAVGTGTDRAAAEQQAADSLVTRINQALGVDVRILSTAKARSSLDSYEASVTAEVTQSGSGRVEGLRIADRYVERHDGSWTVHLLGQYERAAFDAERADRRRLAAERVALYEDPERAADRAAQAGRSLDALSGYLNAAMAAQSAASDGVDGASTVVTRSLRKAGEIVGGATLTARSGPSGMIVGEAPSAPIVFAATDGSGKPLVGVPLEVSYRDRARIVHRMTVRTDDRGLATYTVPRIDAIGTIAITGRIDDAAWLGQLQSLRADNAEGAASILASLGTPRATWQLDVTSKASTIPTTIVVADTDATGNPMPGTRTAEGITDALAASGFTLVAPAVSAGMQVHQPQSAVMATLRNSLPVDVQRAILGVASITDYSQSDGYLVRVSATVSVVDLNTDEILYTATGVKNARSATVDQALMVAFFQLGRALGEQLVANLP